MAFQEDSDENQSVIQFLTLVEQQIEQAEKSKKPGETAVVSVFTPEGRTVAHLFDGAEPNRIIVHGYRQGRRSTVIAPLESVYVAIDMIQQEEEAPQRQIGFRLLD